LLEPHIYYANVCSFNEHIIVVAGFRREKAHSIRRIELAAPAQQMDLPAA
jgi:hypothetical protein